VVFVGAVSVVYARLVVELLVHIVNMCSAALSFEDCSLNHSLALTIESSAGQSSVLTSLQLPASLTQGSRCCVIWPYKFSLSHTSSALRLLV
jgi:hypothetical protein